MAQSHIDENGAVWLSRYFVHVGFLSIAMIVFSALFTVVRRIRKWKKRKWAVYGCLILFGFITYILAMQRFRVVSHGVSRELLISSQYTRVLPKKCS